MAPGSGRVQFADVPQSPDHTGGTASTNKASSDYKRQKHSSEHGGNASVNAGTSAAPEAGTSSPPAGQALQQNIPRHLPSARFQLKHAHHASIGSVADLPAGMGTPGGSIPAAAVAPSSKAGSSPFSLPQSAVGSPTRRSTRGEMGSTLSMGGNMLHLKRRKGASRSFVHEPGDLPATADGWGPSGGLNGAPGDLNHSQGMLRQRAAVPKVVQDTIKCIPLVRLLGRFVHPEGSKPVRNLNRRFRKAVQAVQQGVHKLKNIRGKDAPSLAAASIPPSSPTVHDQSRAVYIQVCSASGLVKPQLQGVQEAFSAYCSISLGGGGAGGAAGGTPGTPRGGGVVRRRTAVHKGSGNSPVWNEVFGFTAAQVAAGREVQFEVWDVDAWGRDFFIGQAELDLTPLLVTDRPEPISAALELVQVDEITGATEAGVYGELWVIAWLGHRTALPTGGEAPPAAANADGADATSPPLAAAAGAEPGGGDRAGGGASSRRATRNLFDDADEDEAEGGFQVSSLVLPPGMPKSLPMVVHSAEGTLYEEPCLMYVKLQVVSLRDINPYALLSTAVTTNRTVKLKPKEALKQQLTSAASAITTRMGDLGPGTSPPPSGSAALAAPLSPPDDGAASGSGSKRSKLRRVAAAVGSLVRSPLSAAGSAKKGSKASGSRGHVEGTTPADSPVPWAGKTSAVAAAAAATPAAPSRTAAAAASGAQAAGETAGDRAAAAGGAPGGTAGRINMQRFLGLGGLSGMVVKAAVTTTMAGVYVTKLAYKGTAHVVTAGAHMTVAGVKGVGNTLTSGGKPGKRRRRRRQTTDGDQQQDRDLDDLIEDDDEAEGGEGSDADDGFDATGDDDDAAGGATTEGEDGEMDQTSVADTGGIGGIGAAGVDGRRRRTTGGGASTGGGYDGAASSLGPEAQAHAADGPGTYYMMKLNFGHHTFRTKLRWMPLSQLSMVNLPHATFFVAVQRPLQEVLVTLRLYITPSPRRKGRLAAVLRVPLTSLMDPSAMGAVHSPEGEHCGVIVPFTDDEFGSAQLLARAADIDWRAALYRVPLSHQEVAAGGPHAASRRVTREDQAPECQSSSPHPRDTGCSQNCAPAAASAATAAPCARSQQPRHGPGAEAEAGPLQLYVGSDPLVNAVLRARYLTACACSRLGLTGSGMSGGSANAAAGSSGLRGLQVGSSSGSLRQRLLSSLQGVLSSNSRTAAAATAAATATASMSGQPMSPGAAAAAAGGASALFGPFAQRSGSSGSQPPGIAAGYGAGGAFPGGGASAAAASKPPRAPVGTVHLRLVSLAPPAVRSRMAIGQYIVLRCGPHWLRSEEHIGGGNGSAALNWEVKLPVYEPNAVLTLGVCEVQNLRVATLVGKPADHVLLGKSRVRLSSLHPFAAAAAAVAAARSASAAAAAAGAWHTIVVESAASGSGASGGSGGAGGPGQSAGPDKQQQGAAAAAGGDGGGTGGSTVLAVLQVRVQYPNLGALLAAYLAPTLPAPAYYLSVDTNDQWAALEKEGHALIERWLSSVQPPIPPVICRALIDSGRSSLSVARATHNFKRVKAALQMFGRLKSWLGGITSWEDLQASSEVAFCIVLLCYYPTTALRLFLALLIMASARQYIRTVCRERCKRLCGATADAADATAAVGDEAAAGAAVPGKCAAAGELEEGEEGPAGTTIQMLRQQYERVKDLALTAQNLFDDLASLLERMQSILSWRDQAATAVFLLLCVGAWTALSLLGLSTLLCVGLLWQIRPPWLRDPLPPGPLNYFTRLPTLDDG